MTRDEHREKCIQAMEEAWYAHYEGRPWRGGAMHSAFDSLHRIARVDPIEVTAEMIEAGRAANVEPSPTRGLYARVWRAMSAAGDLTNPPETKR